MLRSDDSFRPKTKTINVMLLDGGLGDHIAALPACKYILEKYTWIKPIFWMPDYLVNFAKHVLPDGNYEIYGMSNMRGRYEPTRPTKTTKWDGVTSPMKIHLVDYAFLKLLDENPAIQHKNYLQIDPSKLTCRDFDLPEKYAVITTGYTAKVREWPAKEVNKVVDWLLERGTTPVFLGQKNTKTGTAHLIQGKFDEDINLDKGIDLIDKTTLLEAALVMNGAKAVLGVDNGLLHVAGCTKAPIIAGYTTVRPEMRLPIREDSLGLNCVAVSPDEHLSCRFFQQNTNFFYWHDYKNCIYDDQICTTLMTGEKFIRMIKWLELL